MMGTNKTKQSRKVLKNIMEKEIEVKAPLTEVMKTDQETCKRTEKQKIK